jgi:hypothetical protein
MRLRSRRDMSGRSGSDPAKMFGGLTSCFRAAAFLICVCRSSLYCNPHSVNSSPGKTALIRVLGPWVDAMHFMRCRPAALVTEYAIELPPWLIPATEEEMMYAPPSGLALNIGPAACMSCRWHSTFVAQHLHY